ncbi:hypothetical protein [Escherichia coli]
MTNHIHFRCPCCHGSQGDAANLLI